MKKVGIAAALMGIWLTAGAAQAGAADLYVERDSAIPEVLGCADPAAPCYEINPAVTAAESTPGPDTIHVGGSPTSYEPAILTDTPFTLSCDGYNGPGTTAGPCKISSPTYAIHLNPGTSRRRITGMTLAGGDLAAYPGVVSDDHLNAGGTTIIDHNVFEGSGSADTFVSLSGTVTATGNVLDGTLDTTLTGFDLDNLDGPLNVSGNTITGVQRGISVDLDDGPAMTVSDNLIDIEGGALALEAAVYIHRARGVISDNFFTFNPPMFANGRADGITTDVPYGVGDPGSLALKRNRILGFSGYGVYFQGAIPLTSESDVIANNRLNGINLVGVPSLSLTNTTLWDNGNDGGNPTPDAMTQDASITVNSSILENGIDTSAGATCATTYTRGPVTSPGGSACAGPYATTATPNFTHQDDSPDAYDLDQFSDLAFIDTGDPAHPAPGALDVNGDPREVRGLVGDPCAPRRDIGADEAPAVGVCTPPGGGGNAGTAGGTVPVTVGSNAICNALRAKVKKAKKKSKRRALQKKLKKLGC